MHLECVGGAVRQDDIAIELVSLSTTLATNAITEGKRKPVALLLLGYDPQLVYQYHFDQEFGTRHFFFIQGRHGLNGVEQIPLDEVEVARSAMEIKDEVDAFAICSYAGFGNSAHEEESLDAGGDHAKVEIEVKTVIEGMAHSHVSSI